MFLQDIHAKDVDKFKQLQKLWKNRQYTQAIEAARSVSGEGKSLTASFLNDLADRIYQLELNDDPSFTKKKIAVSDIPPQDISVGEVYFQVQ